MCICAIDQSAEVRMEAALEQLATKKRRAAKGAPLPQAFRPAA
jgi:hypothetical protein